MLTKQIHNLIYKDNLQQLINYYNSAKVYETDTMNKLGADNIILDLLPIIHDNFGNNLSYTNGNFYQHNIPYLPHTDYKKEKNNTTNIVIPLQYTGTLPYLVIFDQKWEYDSVTWCLNNPVIYFSYNTGVKGCPYEYPIIGNTNKDIDEIFYNKYLKHHPRECFKGLSGNAYEFKPGSIIIFDNKQIHCTSFFTGNKLGLTLRFKLN